MAKNISEGTNLNTSIAEAIHGCHAREEEEV